MVAAGCGDDENTDTSQDSAGELSAIKDYLTDHSAALDEHATRMNELGQEYYDLAASHDFDYDAMVVEDGEEV